MLVLSFIGLMVSDIVHEGAWVYWRAMVPLYALFCIGLSGYLRKFREKTAFITIWHDILHWLALLAAIYIVSTFVSIGLVGRFEASLQVLVMLALTTFLAGIYSDVIFIIVGILLGCFTAGTAFFTKYLYTIMLPLTILAAALMVYLIYYHSRRNKIS